MQMSKIESAFLCVIAIIAFPPIVLVLDEVVGE